MTFKVSILAGAIAVAMALASVAAAAHLGQNSRAAKGDTGIADLHMEGSVDQATAAVGDSITWHLTADDYNTFPATNVWVDVTLPTNVSLVSSYADRGSGCVTDAPNHLHCSLDWLSKDVQFGHVTVVTKVTGTGDHVLTAIAGYQAADPVPANNTLTLTSTTPTPPPPPPVIGTAAIAPGATAGKRVTVSFPVADSTGAPVAVATIIGTSTVGGKRVTNTAQFANGTGTLTLVIPKKSAGNKLRVSVTVTANGVAATKGATFKVHK
jgi:uncharacterized repeat protein (TIGR01451 family)